MANPKEAKLVNCPKGWPRRSALLPGLNGLTGFYPGDRIDPMVDGINKNNPNQWQALMYLAHRKFWTGCGCRYPA